MPSKAIDDTVMKKMEKNWHDYNATQRRIFNYLFTHQKATKEELASYCDTHTNTIRRYLNQFTGEEILERMSEKQRDVDALYTFKKHH